MFNNILFVDIITKVKIMDYFQIKLKKRKWVHVTLYEIFNNGIIAKVHVTL